MASKEVNKLRASLSPKEGSIRRKLHSMAMEHKQKLVADKRSKSKKKSAKNSARERLKKYL